MSRTLVIRLSALGDVAILIPVLYSVAVKYPEDEFILITKSPFIPIFEWKPSNVRVIPVFTKDKHKGINGLWKLIREADSLKINRVADIHNVLRSRIIDFYFRLKGKKIAVFSKGRQEKQALTRREHKRLVPITSSIDRQIKVFNDLGYEFPLSFRTLFDFGKRDFSRIEALTGAKTGKWIGIAPFAKHEGKMYPLDKMKKVVELLDATPGLTLFLFGSKDEKSILEEWAGQYPSAVCVAGKFRFPEEFVLMSYLDVMLTMDSGNMHLASLVQTPVVSVWGATHPYAGFYGYRQDTGNAVQAELFCRPCSVFGNKPCYRHNYECFQLITPEMIIRKIDPYLTWPES